MKKLCVIICLFLIAVLTAACGNKDLFDTVYTYDYALICFGDGTTNKIPIKQWADYSGSDQIQIIADDGTVYLVHSEDCILVKEK